MNKSQNQDFLKPARRSRVSSAGRAAQGRIAEFRQNINNGATPAEARRIVRHIEGGPGYIPSTRRLKGSK